MRAIVVCRRTASDVMKETKEMPKRLATLATLVGAVVLLLSALPVASASAAPSPWWQVLTGSRPTNMWEPGSASEVQELTAEKFFNVIVAARIEVGGETVGCLGGGEISGVKTANELCEEETGYPADETAAEVQATLEAAYGGNVEVSGGPVGEAPFHVRTADRWVEPVHLSVIEFFGFSLGTASAKVISQDSGRLVVTLTNLGDAPVDATKAPLTISDQLPEGVVAYDVEAVAGAIGSAGPMSCSVEAPDEVVCTFEGVLPSYEALEVEIASVLTGSPPVAGVPGAAPGKVVVSGGNAPTASESQTIKVSAEPTPFGVEKFSAKAEEEGGARSKQAGAHPFQFTTTVQANSGRVRLGGRGEGVEQPALPRNLHFPLPPGLVGNATAVPQCVPSTFLRQDPFPINACPENTSVGVSSVTVYDAGVLGMLREAVPVFNLVPAPGEPARFGFMAVGTPVVIDTSVDPDHGYRITASVHNITQVAEFLSSTLTLWGTPGDPRHDAARGWDCGYFAHPSPCEPQPVASEHAFLREPVQCADPLDFGVSAEPWNVPIGSQVDTASFGEPPLLGCNRVPFDPSISSAATSRLAQNPSGLDFNLTMPNAGLLNKEAIAEGQPKRVEVTLPEGMSINPSEGEGLVGCTEAEYDRETAESRAGEGCPDASKVGSVEISTPLLEEQARGALYVAKPYDNPTGSLIALYMVAKIPDRGILIKQAGKVDGDARTGKLTTTFDGLPQLPFSSFKLHFREGGRAPLVTPPACGSYDVTARFTPWSAQDPSNPAPAEVVTRTSSFPVERGTDGGACPAGGTPPFNPHLDAGTLNNSAASYSPFYLRLTRTDGEQEFTHFSIKLPPGVVAKLAGVSFCPDAAIAAAKARTGPHGGQEELEAPSCPAASEIGHTLVGAGVGSILTYVPGKVYLAGPYHGSPLSIVAITAAKVGPFDLGTVVVREALRINPETAEVFVDATGSDPIPHIIQGIPVHARDIRVYVDRPNFVLNPSSCEPTSTASTVLGSGLDFGSEADDNPITVTSRFQAADCASLGFKPRLSLRLKGKTERSGNPALHAVLRPRVGNANASRISVALPHSEFLDQGHIRTICTRVQFNAGAGNGAECPRGSIYGHAKAWTPLFSEPLEGPIFLRSSEHPLPDLVLALHGLVDIDAVGRIDSVNGGIRNTFDFVPDAPITKVVVNLQGGKKSLLENSTDICRGLHKATVKMEGHNGRRHNLRTPLKASCGKGGKHARSRKG
jgi:hypothetical protein